jgi:hypothetical protein
MITSSTKLLANPDLFASKIDDETVIMDETQSIYFGLNSAASNIWELLKQLLILQQLMTHLLNTYEVSESQCRQDVEKFLHQLLEKNLVKAID